MQNNLFASPMRTQFSRPQCQYCTSKNSHSEWVNDEMSILACDMHKGLAVRDSRAWCAVQGRVQWFDAINEPMFTEGGILAGNEVKFRRGTGVIEDDWQISGSKANFLKRSNDSGQWTIQVTQKYTGLTRSMAIDDLKLTLPEDKWELVDAFIRRLEAGFYKAEYDSFTKAIVDSSFISS